MSRTALKGLLTVLGALALTACTGTQAALPEVRLVILDNTASGPALVVADPSGTDDDNPTPRSTTVPVPGAIGVETLAGTNRFAVAFPDHVTLYQVTDSGGASGLGAQPVNVTNPADPNNPSWFALPQRTNATPASITPCFTKMEADNTRTLLVLLSACPGGAQQEVVLNTSNSDPTASWWRDLPAPYADPSQTFIAVNGNTIYASRLSVSGTGSDVLQGAFSDGQTQMRVTNTGGQLPIIRDLVNAQGTVYAATDDSTQGVRPVNATDLGTARLTPRANRLFADSDLLAAWNDASQLFFARGAQSNTATPLSAYDVRGVAVPPDGYAYALSGASLIRYDVLVGLAAPNNSFNATSVYLPTGLSNPTDIAWVVPQ